MDEVIIFDKSLNERLEEYQDVFPDKKVPGAYMAKEWSYFIELTVDRMGWQAIWKFPRQICKELGISFPSMALVLVLDVDVQDLKALVRVVGVQDDIEIPEKHYVPLIQLWPTKKQDKSLGLSLTTTANALDIMRFFYLYLFMPWDLDDDESSDWKSDHLQSRLRLYYDMKYGIIPRFIGEHLHTIISEAKQLQSKRESIEQELLPLEEDPEVDEDLSKSKIEALADIHLRITQIRSEVDIVENEMLRNALIRQQNQLMEERKSNPQNVWLVSSACTADKYLEFLQKVKEILGDITLTFCSNLASKLESVNSSDVFVLNEGRHVIQKTGALEHGGQVKGAGDKSQIILSSTADTVALDLYSNTIEIENITIYANNAQIAILIRGGKVILRNCNILGNNGPSVNLQAIIALNGAELELIDCQISGFSTGIVGNSESKISMLNTEVFDVDFGMKIYDNCIVDAKNSTFRDCNSYGVVVETDRQFDAEKPNQVGTFASLTIIPEVKAKLNGKNNVKGDVKINHKSKLYPIEDLFKDGEDPTIIRHDEKMETSQSNLNFYC